MMTTWDDEYIPSKDKQDNNDDDKTSNYSFLANDQNKEVVNPNLDTSMSYDELHSTLNELMEGFHKVLTK